MKTNYTIKNFRVFGNEGANVKIAPLTILTGCNSSGKSSIVKSILLLNTFLIKIKQAVANESILDLGNYTMDFDEYPLNLLGRFDKVINSKSDSGEIEFKFESENKLEIVLTFVSRKEDVLNRGYLKKIMIYKGEEEVYSSQNGACHLNILPLLEDYLQSTNKSLKTTGLYGECELYEVAEYKKLHKVSLETINWVVENNSLFRVPLLEKIGHLSKDEFLVEMKEIFSPVYDNIGGLEQLINRLSVEFTDSEYESFNDFFKAREKKWMSNLSNIEDESPKITPKDWTHNIELFLGEERWMSILKSIAKKCDKLKTLNFGFPFLLATLVYTGSLIGLNIDGGHGERIEDSKFGNKMTKFKFYLWEDFKGFVNRQLEKALIPSWSGMLSYVGSSRIDVKRLYTLDAKSDFTSLLNRYFNARRDFVGRQENEYEEGYKPDAFINKWLKEFGICDSVTLDMDPEGLGVAIKLHKEGRTILLADEGYGITQLFSILLEIEAGIQMAYHHFLVKGWYGQNYVFIEDMHTNKILFPEQTILIEEPEIHLHPKYQSILADMLVEAYQKYNIHFIVETHSEYLIRKLQVLVSGRAENVVADNSMVSIYYINSADDKCKQKVKRIGICNDGYLDDTFGEGFYDEAIRLSRQLM